MPQTTEEFATGPYHAQAVSSSPSKERKRQRLDSLPITQRPQVSSQRDPKRQRSNEHEEPRFSAAAKGKAVAGVMSVQGPQRQPAIIDLTRSNVGPRPSAFQPHVGAKKLVIKNLRPVSSKIAAKTESYYARAWADLDSALTRIFASQQPQQPLEQLYKSCEDICRSDSSEKLYELLSSRIEKHLNGSVLPGIQSDASDDVSAIRAVLAAWHVFSRQTTLIRSIFSYLDRTFLLTNKALPVINDLAITQFRRMAFTTPARDGGNGRRLGAQALAGMCELIDYDRRGDERFDGVVLKDAINMLHIFGIYLKSFEPRFLVESNKFFEGFAEERSAGSDLKSYIGSVERLLQREDERCARYNFDSTSQRQLLNIAHSVLIEKYAAKLSDNSSVAHLLDDNEVDYMHGLYDLLRLSSIEKRLKVPWEAYILHTGTSIVSDTTRGDDMVVRLLELRRKLDIMIRDAFRKDEEFSYCMRDAFGHFINDRKVLSGWGTGTSKVGEMIAKHIDMLLRGGLKTLPKSLLSDNKDKAEAEQSGVASTGDEDAELDRQLDSALELFRFIEGKDVFEAFYKRDLARRLLMGRSASQDAERNMLTKLKSECGSSFTHNLETMFKDQALAREEMDNYKDWKAGTGVAPSKEDVDLQVSILSSAAWPTYPDVQLSLPPEVLQQIEHFDRYYRNKHTGRTLTWKHNLAHCVVKAKFDRGTKELLVSAFQAVVLVLFNSPGVDGFLSYDQISSATGLSGGELERTLQSLACGKVRVLNKHPKGRDVNPTDTFTINKTFSDPRVRVKINQIQLKETKEENKETHERVAADRQFETQAAIVRIMKSRKKLTHNQLVAEVINQTKSRGAVDASEIKKNIEK
jgi:cullin 4